MTDIDQQPPAVLSDTKRPPVPARMARWLKEQDQLRAARERGASADEIDRLAAQQREKP